MTEDRATSLGGTGAVDGTVRAIQTAYTGRGLVAGVTSYNSPADRGAGNVVNHVAQEQDDGPSPRRAHSTY